ncbi:MAG: hypothetical protein HC916_20075 [Coleofasciculaceae cyanobacterium SM2_1_6]|nr:hypothetical protein [Coleofasciculaceae cyanobacterium SM2_1_6]
MAKLTEKQAFFTMISFLEDYYQNTQAEEIAILLGSLQVLQDGSPADPATWSDWQKSLQKVLQDNYVLNGAET